MHRQFCSGEILGYISQQSELAALIERFTCQDGEHQTAIGPLHLIRSSVCSERNHNVYEPALFLVAQGCKQVMLAEEAYQCGPAQYLVVAADLPVISQIVEATPQTPLLSLYLSIDPQQISTFLAESDLPTTASSLAPERGMTAGCMDTLLLDAVTRLLRLLDTPQHIAVLAPHIIREILYLLLVNESGATLRQIAFARGEKQGIVRAIRWLKDNFAEPLKVDDLAREAHMSPSVFHQHFKSVTALTPLQYQKRLRLQEARCLLLGEAVDVGTAGFQVGYESQSQFNREYRRLFGASPLRDIARLRDSA